VKKHPHSGLAFEFSSPWHRVCPTRLARNQYKQDLESHRTRSFDLHEQNTDRKVIPGATLDSKRTPWSGLTMVIGSCDGSHTRLKLPIILLISFAFGSPLSYYDVLEVPKDAPLSEIKKAYRRLALKWHPDKSQDLEASQRFRQVAEAYEVLGNTERRSRYDAGDTAGTLYEFREADDIFKEFFGSDDPFKMFDKVFEEVDRDIGRIIEDVSQIEKSAGEQAGGFFSMVSSFFSSFSGGGQKTRAGTPEEQSSSPVPTTSAESSHFSGHGPATCSVPANCTSEKQPWHGAPEDEKKMPSALPGSSPFAPGGAAGSIPTDKGPGATLTAAAAARRLESAIGRSAPEYADEGGAAPALHSFGQQPAGGSPFAKGGGVDAGDVCSKATFRTGEQPVDTAVKHTAGSACCNPLPQLQPIDRLGCCRRCQTVPDCEVYVLSPRDGSCWLLQWKADDKPTMKADDRIMGERPN